MAEISQAIYTLTNNEKQRVQEIDSTIMELEHQVDNLNEFIQNSGLDWKLIEAKLKRERLIALTALANSKVMLAEVEMYIAKNEKNINKNYINSKKVQTSQYSEGTSQQTSSESRRQSLYSSRNDSPYSRNRSKSDKIASKSGLRNNRASTKPTTSTAKSKFDSNHVDNKFQNPMSKVPSLISDTNKYLTNTIIADIEKPCLQKQMPAMSESNSNLSVSKLESLASYKPQSSKAAKIKPVSNITAYTHNNMIYSPYVIYAPPSAEVKPSLYPGDPRAYYWNQSKSQKQKPQSPLELPVPKIVYNNFVPNSNKQTTENIKKYEIKSPTKLFPSLFTPEKLNETEEKLISNLSSSNNNSSAAYQPISSHMSLSSAPKQVENMLDSKYNAKPYNNVDRKPIFPSNNIPNCSKNPEHQLKLAENKHICVPIPPMYNHSVRQYQFSHNSKNNCSGNIALTIPVSSVA